MPLQASRMCAAGSTKRGSRGSHAVNVVLLGVGACQEHALDGRLLVWPEGVHARALIVQRLPNLHNGMPRDLQALC